ncbi:hypothetical protein [Miniphocaeibacter halophilus]|uniref:Uncharacterized protein n=1 Tax=Miniphocaeibacter halophilus TaxID=2931922 RepID=A0AC61MRB2_9FIRM|nr:hypothetical protein [Miniphocaeibacter halophilus]QQK08076.1 hypothetical protein JFY71_00640 [Miniphocaeibacter halophilus]
MKEEIIRLLEVSDYDYYRYLLNQDPIRKKIDEDTVDYLISKSVKCGEDEANKILGKYNNDDIFNIVKEMNLNIVFTDSSETGYYGYFEEPNKIVIYNNSIEGAFNFFEKYTDISINKEYIEKVVLAHELFHYVEYKNPNLFINTYKIELWSILKYTRRSNIVYLGEIAAMAFANKLIGKNTYSHILDYILLFNLDKKQADVFLQEITK